MMKSVIAAAAGIMLMGATVAGAETPAANSDDCLKVAFDIAQAAESQNLSNEKLDKVEELLTKMETHCDAKQFTEAAAVATDLKQIISKE
jgi:hypothetical protein